MNKVVLILIALIFLATGCIVPPGQVKKHTAPGQIKKVTGVNPASGKVSKKRY